MKSCMVEVDAPSEEELSQLNLKKSVTSPRPVTVMSWDDPRFKETDSHHLRGLVGKDVGLFSDEEVKKKVVKAREMGETNVDVQYDLALRIAKGKWFEHKAVEIKTLPGAEKHDVAIKTTMKRKECLTQGKVPLITNFKGGTSPLYDNFNITTECVSNEEAAKAGCS